MTQTERLQKIRTKLLLTDSPKFVFIANLLQVQDVFDTTIETAATDGSSIRWNPAFIDSITDAELLGVMIHELMHIGLLHNVTAIGFDDHKRLNIAADLAINSIIKDMGLKLPAGGCFAGEGPFAHLKPGKSLEEYYSDLQDMADDELPNEQPGAVEAAGSEERRNTPPGKSPAMSSEMAGEILRAVVGEALRKSQSAVELPQVLSKAIQAALAEKVDYKHILRKYRTKLTRGGQDWNRPNRRVAASGAQIARNRTRKINNVLVLLDCSGSMSESQVGEMLTEIHAVFSEVAGSVHVWQHDTKIVHKDELQAGKPLPAIERKTFGNTSHVQPFAEIVESGINADVVICMTDCQTRYPDEFGAKDVLWISNTPVSDYNVPPVGELIVI